MSDSSIETYWIREGVRRAKAYSMAGVKAVTCAVYTSDSRFVEIKDIAIDQLRTTKFSIELLTAVDRQRFESIVEAIADGKTLPLLMVQKSRRGWPLADVGFDEGNE